MIDNRTERNKLPVAQKVFMKAFYLVLLTLVAFSAGPSSAQETKTVATCRAYREAWLTSTDKDLQQLSVREFVQRANQMMACAQSIDNQPFTAGMSMDEALKLAVAQAGYAILASAYLQEAFTRASWFIDNKGLSSEFLTADRNGKILKPGR